MIIYVPKDVAIVPRTGECIVNSWWIVHPQYGLAFYRIGHRSYEPPAPQCNVDEAVANFIRDKIYSDCTVELIPVVYINHLLFTDKRDAAQRKQFYANGKPMWAKDGTLLDDRGNRSIFDDVDQ